MKNRSHQDQVERIAKEIIAGKWPRKEIITDTTPGGGKTGQSIIMASRLMAAGIVRQVFHFVPRKTLQSQVCDSWRKSRGAWNIQDYKMIESSQSTPLFPKDYAGIVATYGQLDANVDLYVDQARRAPTLVVFDELQFLGDRDNQAWVRAARAIASEATMVLGMSGTLYRHDRQELPFVTYGNTNPDTGKDDGLRYAVADIRYTLRQAVKECAVKGADFIMLDGDVKWLDGFGEQTTSLSSADDEQQSRALSTFLSRTKTWEALADRWVEHWKSWRREVYPSRAIAIALDQEQARMIVAYLRKRHGLDAALAISDEDDAHAALARFRGEEERGQRGTPDVLVTVAMASVGFDVQDCTHLLYLSNYRSLPYALQAFARVTRVDGKCNIAPVFQRAFIFVPDDPKMRTIVEWLEKEAAQGVRDRIVSDDSSEAGAATRQETFFVPLEATPGGVSYANMDGRVDGNEAAAIANILATVPAAAGIAPTTLAQVLRAASAQHGWTPRPDNDGSVACAPVPKERARRDICDDVERLGRMLDARSKSDFGTTNRVLVPMFGPKKARTDSQLADCLAFIKGRLSQLDRGDELA